LKAIAKQLILKLDVNYSNIYS